MAGQAGDVALVDDLRSRGEQGDTDAQLTIGIMYGTGQGVRKDYVQAYI